MREVTHKAKKLNIPDRMARYFFPGYALRRAKARATMALVETYQGASKTRRAMSEWNTSSGDADTDTISHLPDLRNNSSDLIRNNPIACGAINTKVTNIVGTGLVLQSRINREILNLTEDQADEWERKTEFEFGLWSGSSCDTEKTLTFLEMQALALRSTLERGDVFILLPMIKKRSPYQLSLQMIEADRVSNPDNQQDSDTLAGGVEKDEHGAPIKYHVLEGHPGNYHTQNNAWKAISAYGAKTGRKNIIHLYSKLRVGQTRGVPDLAPVIEDLKQMGRYTEAEIQRAVISSFFTVFIKSEFEGGLDVMEPQTEIGGKATDKDFKMGSGAMLDLNPNEDVEFANPTSPNQSFEPFMLAIARQIGVALELPFELLMKHFTSSYSASRASLLMAWHTFMTRRKWLSIGFCVPIYELFLTEAIALGRIVAPGFLSGDPAIKQAYLGAEWIGPAKGQIDEKKEIEAAVLRINEGISSLSSETAAITGGDWEKTHKQRVKEVKKRKEDGIETQIVEKKDTPEEVNDENN